MSTLLALAPMSMEAGALRRGAPGALVARTGAGPSRAAAGLDGHLATARRHGVAAVAVAGVAGGLVAGMVPGQVV
ncbi:MAG: hypothetical protein M0T80_05540, partial [Actinomycetota bacterium]|nr:hypothetical protein [Actinomycetota bacterium]